MKSATQLYHCTWIFFQQAKYRQITGLPEKRMRHEQLSDRRVTFPPSLPCDTPPLPAKIVRIFQLSKSQDRSAPYTARIMKRQSRWNQLIRRGIDNVIIKTIHKVSNAKDRQYPLMESPPVSAEL